MSPALYAARVEDLVHHPTVTVGRSGTSGNEMGELRRASA
jgi:hypothetical protein